jgi:hypothetical protein
MPGSGKRTEVLSLFGEATRNCEQAVARHLESARSPGLHFSKPVTLAIALLAEYGERSELGDDDLALLGTAAAEAAAACRSQPPGEAIVAATAAFAEVARVCNQLIQPSADPSETAGWRRFSFSDADIEVSRTEASWRVRAGGRESEHKLLDEALNELLQLSNFRIGQLTVQILDWTTRAAP